jgi:hypothetical protein
LQGPRLGGGSLSTRDLLGRPTVVLHWLPPTEDGAPQDDTPGVDRLLTAAAEHVGDLNVLLVAGGEPTPGAAAAYLEQQGADIPVIFDWDGSLKRRWGLELATTLVLLDAEGRVAEMYGPEVLRDPADLIDAFLAGDPLPSAAPLGS